jgi:hypothetical protein
MLIDPLRFLIEDEFDQALSQLGFWGADRELLGVRCA